MQRAWGLHKEARFRDLDNNLFVVHLGCEGDWKHVLNSGSWQYDSSVLILKDYEGGTRPSEMVIDKIDVWLQVLDLPPDKRTEELGIALGNLMGKIVRVDVDNDDLARGYQLRVRTTIYVFEPLVHGFYLKSSPEDKSGMWYGFSYEKVPHFCFECGRLVHVDGVCVPPVDSTRQWGSWLRTSSGKMGRSREESQGATSRSNNGMGRSKTEDSDRGKQVHLRANDPVAKRNLQSDFSRSASSRWLAH
ncbi:hypothetical protein D1007_32632 [Hordeum vulgare]|nr:hypothetical protein D1007_32632 [Hordeum vulgare]